MFLRQIEQFPQRAQQYVERWVNDGSPSGFSELHRSSAHTDPYGSNPWFHLDLCEGPADWFRDYGRIPFDMTGTAGPAWILLHPDTTPILSHLSPQVSFRTLETLRVVPTASSRTVQILDSEVSAYVKLHYPGVLGRIRRELPYLKGVSGVEISRELASAIDNSILSEHFAILPEVGVRALQRTSASGPVDIGMLWRAGAPYGKRSGKIVHLWPLFALYSTDRLSPLDPIILDQLIAESSQSPVDYILEKILFPVLESYFQLVLRLGFNVGFNAQNLMVGLTSDFDICSVVLRDLARIEKDLSLRSSLRLSTQFESWPHRCISKEDGEAYQIRHSFAFDFKMTEYIIAPFVALAQENYGIDRETVNGRIRDQLKPLLRQLPDSYFPANGCWYKYDRILLTEGSPFVEVPNPRYR